MLARFTKTLVILMGVAIIMQPFQASAHSGSVGYSEITVEENVIDYDLYLLADLVGGLLAIDKDQDGYMTEDELNHSKDSIKKLIVDNLHITSNGEKPEVTVKEIKTAERWNYSMFNIVMEFEFDKPVTEYAIQYEIFFDGIDMNHQNFMTVQHGGSASEHVITANNKMIEGKIGSNGEAAAETESESGHAANQDETEVAHGQEHEHEHEHEESRGSETEEQTEEAVSTDSGSSGDNGNGSTGFVDYLVLGMTHIWGGIDHLLFIVGLLLMRGSVKDYIKILTAFTVGHSLTLGLAAMEIFIIPGSIIEPLIALSIVYVAIENILAKKRGDASFKGRWIVVLFFGLIHGFGFAGFLAGKLEGAFVLPLLSFNLGVEIGQIVVLAILFPIIWYMRKLRYQTQIMYSASALVSLFGLYWLIERLI
ncbi:HupE/UreJ family protein [Rossellomorea aquimaris]|nr:MULTISPECIES: HupE/UreJ family protein [Bacillaceae]